jgi:orotate phosphoribosyltransferase
LGQQVDGDLKAGDKVIVVDDVTTTGNSILAAIETVKSLGGEVTGALTVVDREEGGKEALAAAGYELLTLYSRYDFTDKRPEDVK